MKHSYTRYILILSLLCAYENMKSSEKPDNQKLDQALRQFQGLCSKAALAALENKGYVYKPKDGKMELSPKASNKSLKKNGQTKAPDSLDF